MKLHFQGHRACLIPANILLLGSILVVGALLRFNNITQPFTDAFSWRQASTAMMASNFYHRSWNIFYPEVSWTGPSPGYQGREFQTVSYIAALLYMIAGEHDWVGRAVPALFGVWGIFALYQLVRRVWDEEHALLSTAVLALLPSSIFIDRSFLPDPAMVALMTTSVWMLVAYLQTDRLSFLVLAGITGTWGLLTKLPGLVVSLAMIYATLTILQAREKLNQRKLAVISVVAILSLLPVIAYYVWALHLGRAYPPYHVAGDGNWLWNQGLRRWLDQRYFLPRLSPIFNHWLWTQPVIVLVTLGIIFPFLGLRSGENSGAFESRGNISPKAPWLFHWWLFGGVPCYLIAAKELVSNVWNFEIINPAAAALASHAVITIALFITKITPSFIRSFLKATIVAVSLATIAVFGGRLLERLYHPYSKQSYELGLALRAASHPRDLVVTIPNNLGNPIAIYYSRRRGWPFPPPTPVRDIIELPPDDNESIQMFEQLRIQGATWLGIVAAQQGFLQREHPFLLAHFERSSRLYRRDPKWVIYSILPENKKN
jgi:Dolichyl-phosphate-mannose-protein mannosyltransferase